MPLGSDDGSNVGDEATVAKGECVAVLEVEWMMFAVEKDKSDETMRYLSPKSVPFK
jgi:hypothetical protein